MNKKTKDFLYKFGIVLACIGALGSIVAIGETIYQHSKGGSGGGGGVPSKPTVTTQEIAPTFFTGGIADTTGQYESSTAGLYNRYAFNAKNLNIKLDAGHNLGYQVFFYDAQDTFLSKTETFKASSRIEVPEGANARIEILPDSKAVTWDTAPIIANKLHVIVDKGQKVDIKGLKGINDSGYVTPEDGNLMQVLNGTYSGPHYSYTVKNGLVTYHVSKDTSDLVDYECVDAPLEKEITGNVSFELKNVSGKATVAFYALKLDKPQTAERPDSIYMTFRTGQSKDLATTANGTCKAKAFALHERTVKITEEFSVIPRWYTTPIV